MYVSARVRSIIKSDNIVPYIKERVKVMSTKYSIAGYCRISVDEEMDRDNTSIENQKAIITDFVKRKFPDSTLEFYEDRDRSGYTFEQREGYQELRKKMLRMEYDILIVKDFSRFSRRNSKGLVELEDLRDAGMRIISIGDNIDYPTYDDWTAIQFRFLINEMPVTDTSKKVKSVIKRRQEEGKWICAVPYGYVMTNSKTMKFDVDEPAAQVVRDIFEKYNEGWGYKKIANYLTEKHIPTPRMCEKMRKEANGEECKREAKQTWSLVTISEILSNDFYIGTLRQGKYRRKRINGDEVKQHETDHVEIRGCELTRQILGPENVTPADDDDYATEFLDYIISIKVVDDMAEALEHIDRFSTGHSECIVTESLFAAQEFQKRVDSAAVYVNCSTRFTDGGMFGLGAEIGISTQKLHARGPMGLREMTTTKYLISGKGQIRE